MEYSISSDKSKLDVQTIHDYLCHQSYWAKGRSLERVQESIDNSLCFGMYDVDDKMLGFARVITDKVVFAYLMDVIVFEAYQGNGLGTQLVRHIVQHPELQVRVWFLGTKTAHDFYRKLGFDSLPEPQRYMCKLNPQFA